MRTHHLAHHHLRFDVPVPVAFAYLADPRNRPEWQSSLRRVELLDEGEPRVGMRWRDHTAVRMVPEMDDHRAGAGRALGRDRAAGGRSRPT